VFVFFSHFHSEEAHVELSVYTCLKCNCRFRTFFMHCSLYTRINNESSKHNLSKKEVSKHNAMHQHKTSIRNTATHFSHVLAATDHKANGVCASLCLPTFHAKNIFTLSSASVRVGGPPNTSVRPL